MRSLRQMKSNGIAPKKIKKACDYIFRYLEQEDFNLRETEHLISSMGNVISRMTQNDPLRKIGGFNYSSSIEDSFPVIADSKTES